MTQIGGVDVAANGAPLSLRRNFSWTFVGNVAYAASQWGVLIVIAKLGTPQLLGQFALALALAAPVIALANLQLRAVQATDARRDYSFGDYLGLRILTTVAGLLAILLLAFVGGYPTETTLVIALVGLAKTFEAFSDLVFGLLQQHERMDRIARSLMIRGPATLVAMALTLYLGGSMAGATLSMVLVWGTVLALYDVPSAAQILRMNDLTRVKLQPCWDAATLRRLTILALPLGVTMLFLSLQPNIPRYFIERYRGEAQLGIFAALAYLMVAGNTVVAALGQASTPRLAVYFADRQRQAFKFLMLKLAAIGALLGAAGVIVALVAGKFILSLLYGAEYSAHTDTLLVVMVAAGLAYIASFLGYGMTAARLFRIQVPINVVFVGVSLLGSVVLIPAYGILGAALVAVTVFAVQVPVKAAVLVGSLRALAHDEVYTSD